MRSSLKRRKPGRKVGLAALLVTAALVVSGCDWARITSDVYGKNVAVKKGITDNLIFGCTAEHGAGYARARCVLDNIWSLCQGAPRPAFSMSECLEATDHSRNVEAMFYAITKVIGASGPDGDCLTYRFPFGASAKGWDGNTMLGERGCV